MELKACVTGWGTSIVESEAFVSGWGTSLKK